MRMQRIVMATLTLALLCGAATAQDFEMRFDVKGSTKGAKLQVVDKPEGGAGYNASWVKDEDEKARYLTFRKNLKGGEWQKITFSFQSDVDTKVWLNLNAKWKRGEDGKMVAVPTLYDDISAEGAELSTDFEDATNDGDLKIPGWSVNQKKRPELVDDATKAHGGTKCLKVTNSTAIATTVNAKAGEKVTITLWAKPGE